MEVVTTSVPQEAYAETWQAAYSEVTVSHLSDQAPAGHVPRGEICPHPSRPLHRLPIHGPHVHERATVWASSAYERGGLDRTRHPPIQGTLRRLLRRARAD